LTKVGGEQPIGGRRIQKVGSPWLLRLWLLPLSSAARAVATGS